MWLDRSDDVVRLPYLQCALGLEDSCTFIEYPLRRHSQGYHHTQVLHHDDVEFLIIEWHRQLAQIVLHEPPIDALALQISREIDDVETGEGNVFVALFCLRSTLNDSCADFAGRPEDRATHNPMGLPIHTT